MSSQTPSAITTHQWPGLIDEHTSCLELSLGSSHILSMEPAVSFTFLQRFTSGLDLRRAFSNPGSSEQTQLLLIDDTETSHCPCNTVPIFAGHPCLLCTPVGLCALREKAAQITNDLSSSQIPYSRLIGLKEFFSADHLLRSFRFYWSDWHPNLPIIHPSTFTFESAAAPLIATMAVIGACHSTDRQERANSKVYYDMLERYVFVHLSSFRGRVLEGKSLRAIVQALQAAYLVLIYQSWDGEHAARLSVRRKRFAQMVEAVQAIGMSRAVHKDYRYTDPTDFDLRAFIEMEELIRLVQKIHVP